MECFKEKIICYPNEIISEGEEKYFYNFTTNGLFLLDDISLNILHNKINDEKEYLDTIELMKQKFVIKTEDNMLQIKKLHDKLWSLKGKARASSLILMICQKCNLRCTYCYGGDGEYNHKGIMKKEVAIKAVDYFLAHSSEDINNICFFGGEPLLNFKLIKIIVDYSKAKARECGKKITFSMTTNATLIDKEIEEFIIQNKIHLTVSIDGNREIQNANRYYVNREGSYDDVIKNTERLRKTNLLTVRATITSKNTDILQNVDHLINVGFKRIVWAPALNLLSDQDMKNIIKNQKKVIEKVKECIVKGDFIQAKKYTTIINMLNKLDSDGIRTKGCGTGTNMLAVDILGDIYPCHRFVSNNHIKLGNIYDDQQYENAGFSLSVQLKEFGKCGECIARNICAGGCVNENLEINHDMKVAPEIRCKYYVGIMHELLRLYVYMNNHMKRNLFGR